MRKPDLSKLHFTGGPNVPTMIVPPGTLIQVDTQGQVSIRTPGNLVLQNSGSYATLESVSGSIRIEPSVHVEAVTVRCADTCMVQGSLTAWRVVAHTLHVDTDAEAHVVMQETEKLEVGKNGRVVGNFRSEQELFALFSRFSSNVRALPPLAGEAPPAPTTLVAQVEPRVAEAAAAGSGAAEPFLLGDLEDDEDEGEDQDLPAGAGVNGAGQRSSPVPADLPDQLSLALLLLEQQRGAEGVTPSARRACNQLLRLLRESDVDTLRHTYKTLFARLHDGGEGVRRARRAVGAFFEAEVGSAEA